METGPAKRASAVRMNKLKSLIRQRNGWELIGRSWGLGVRSRVAASLKLCGLIMWVTFLMQYGAE